MTRMTGSDRAVQFNEYTHAQQREQWKGPLATQPDRENGLSQTNRGVGGVCVGVVPRVQSKLSLALHAHRGKKLLQDL